VVRDYPTIKSGSISTEELVDDDRASKVTEKAANAMQNETTQ